MAFERDPRHRLWRLLMTAEWRMTDQLTGRIKREFDLTPAQFEALVVLSEGGGACLSMSELSGHLLYSSGSATHLVDRLAQRGLVARSAPGVGGGDGRRVDVALTADGRALIENALAAHRGDLDELFAPLVPDDELATLTAFATRMLRATRD